MTSKTKTQGQKQTPKPTPKPKENRRGVGTWMLFNGVALIVLWIFISKIIAMNPYYTWIKESYMDGNMQMMKEYPDLTNDERLLSKLGADLNFVFYLRDNTPENAVIYYPTSADFKAGHPAMEQNPFNGKIYDKLAVVRFVYPRKVVVASEYGKTSWSKKITHVAVVNGKNTDKVPYPVGENFVSGILPMTPPKQPSK